MVPPGWLTFLSSMWALRLHMIKDICRRASGKIHQLLSFAFEDSPGDPGWREGAQDSDQMGNQCVLIA